MVKPSAISALVRVRSMLDAVAVFGLAGSICWAAGWTADAAKPHLRRILH